MQPTTKSSLNDEQQASSCSGKKKHHKRPHFQESVIKEKKENVLALQSHNGRPYHMERVLFRRTLYNLSQNYRYCPHLSFINSQPFYI